MSDPAQVTPELLRSLLDYDPLAGTLTWKQRPIEMFERRRLGLAWNTRYAGKPAFNHSDHGYLAGRLFGKKVYAHRAAVALITGLWPDNVDHINGDPADNRAENLRAVSHTTNLRNAKRRIDNKSGVCGVFWNTRDGKWQAKIRVDQRDIALGQFVDINAAREARRQAEVLYGFHPNHGRAA